MIARTFKIGKFLAAGLPAALLAIPANYLLVELGHFPKPAAYAIVLGLQVVVNFFACRYFVFARTATTSLARQFVQFTSGILAFRLADWILYSLLVGYFGAYFTMLQVFNIVLFALMKFRFSERIMEEGAGEK